MEKAQALAALRKKPVAVTVGDTTFHVKPFTVAQKEGFAIWQQANPGLVGVAGKLIAASLCDEDGKSLNIEAEEIGDLDGALCEALCDQIVTINGMRGAKEDDAKNS